MSLYRCRLRASGQRRTIYDVGIVERHANEISATDGARREVAGASELKPNGSPIHHRKVTIASAPSNTEFPVSAAHALGRMATYLEDTAGADQPMRQLQSEWTGPAAGSRRNGRPIEHGTAFIRSLNWQPEAAS